MTDDNLQIHLRVCTTGFLWFVYDGDNGHVLAQGHTKREATAMRQAKEAVLLLRADLWQSGTSPL